MIMNNELYEFIESFKSGPLLAPIPIVAEAGTLEKTADEPDRQHWETVMMIPHGQLKVETLLQSALNLEGHEEQFVQSFYSALETDCPGLYLRVLRFDADERYQSMIGYFNLVLDCLPTPGSLIVTARNVGREMRLRGISVGDVKALESSLLVAMREVMADKWTPAVADAWTKALRVIRTLIARPTCMLHRRLDWVSSAS